MKFKQPKTYWYSVMIFVLPMLSMALLYLESVLHQEFLLHLAAIPVEILFGAILVERLMASRDKQRRAQHWAFVKSCLMRSQLRELLVVNFAGLQQPVFSLEQIRDATIKQLRTILPQLSNLQYSSTEAMDAIVDEYVSAYQTFYNLMEWSIKNDFEAIFHDMIYVLHFIHDVESFRVQNPGKSFVTAVKDNPEKFAKMKTVLSDGIIKFVEYAIELKQHQPEVFQTLITDIVDRASQYNNEQQNKPTDLPEASVVKQIVEKQEATVD